MTKFHYTILFFWGAVALLWFTRTSNPFLLWSLLGCGLVFVSVVAYGCYEIRLNFFIHAVNKINTDQKVAALTFDDGPATGATENILAVLNEKKVKATFFCIGKAMAENSALLQHIHKAGHQIANHSYSHTVGFTVMRTAKVLAELAAANACIASVTGQPNRYCRPPFGVTNPQIAAAIRQSGMQPVGWSIRTLDTTEPSLDKIIQKIDRELNPGSILLFHDTSRVTQAGLAQIIDHIHAKGYRLLRIDELINTEK